jgi:hypothetical protein
MLVFHLGHLLPNGLYLKLFFWSVNGYKLNLSAPVTFCEKIQWLKLNDHKPIYHRMVDKVNVKSYITEKIGEQYVIPTLAVWETLDDIDITQLPNKFVLKTTTGGGSHGVQICRDKSQFDLENAKKLLKQSSRINIFSKYKEWAYKDVKLRYFAEQYIEDCNNEDLVDYKVYCFNGMPKYIQVIRNRNTKETIDFFDTNWNHQSFIGLNPKAERSRVEIKKPRELEQMLDLAKRLSYKIPFLRVDLYNVNGKVYFGETTFYPASGFGKFNPNEWDTKLGAYIDLSI